MINIKQNLFLIGMMGSWKSTVGRRLAEALNMEFVDTDDVIEEVTEMKISDIFSQFGEDRFREMEMAFFSEKTKKAKQVFSTGGGIVLRTTNRKILKNNGTTFFLNASIKILASRIHNAQKRPLLHGSENLESRLKQIWEDRKKYYISSAHHTIQTDDLSPPLTLDKILNLLEVSLENH